MWVVRQANRGDTTAARHPVSRTTSIPACAGHHARLWAGDTLRPHHGEWTASRQEGETRGLYSPPATVILPTSIEPQLIWERGSTSLPTASIPANTSFKLPAMVMPSTG